MTGVLAAGHAGLYENTPAEIYALRALISAGVIFILE